MVSNKHPSVVHPKFILAKELNALESFNKRTAILISNNVGTMYCAYLFAVVGIASLVGVFTNNALMALVAGSISSYFIQLVLLPIIMVAQNVQQEATNAKQETDHEALTYLARLQDEQMEILKRLDTKK